MNLIVYIRERLASIFTNTVIAITYAVIDIRDLKSRYVSYTSSISLPLDENNRAIIGLSDQVESTSSVPYSEIRAKAIIDGYEFNGKLKIQDISNQINANIFDDGIEIYDFIKGKKLYELYHITPTAWNASDIDGFRASTNNVISPVIDWGDFDTAGNSINSDYYLPSYFYMELIVAILESTGYTVTGDVLNDTDFTDLSIPFSSEAFEYLQEYQDERTFSAENTSNQIILSDASEKIIVNNVISQGLQGWYQPATSRFQIPNFSSTGDIGSVDLYVQIEFNIEMGYPPSIAEERIQIIKNGSTVVATRSVFPVDEFPADYLLSFNVKDYSFQDGDYYEVFFTSFNEIPDIVTISKVNFYGNVTRKPFRNLLFHSYLLPDLEQSEVLQDFFIRSGGFIEPDSLRQTINVRTIKEVINNKAAAKDWTIKRVSILDKIAFEYEGYARENYFKYDSSSNTQETLGMGILPVNNANLEASDDYYDSIFSNSITQQPANTPINMAYIPVFDNTSVDIYDFKNSPEIRLLTLRNKMSGEPDIIFNVTPRSNYKVAYFVDDTQSKDTGFQYFIDQWYSELILSFDKVKLVSRSYYLIPGDIGKGLQMIYDGGNYFLVNKVPKFIEGKVTSGIELLRVF